GSCFPATVTENGKRVETLHLTNCKVGARDSFDDPDDVFYSLDVIRSKVPPLQLKIDDVDNRLLELGLCSACAHNVAYLYVNKPASRCAKLAGRAKRSFPLSTFATHCSSLMRSSWMGVLLGTDAQEVGGFFLDVCRPCGDCEGEVGREGGRDGVFGDGGEVVKQGVEAVDGETIVGSAGGLLGEGGGRSLSLCDRALAERLGGLLVGVVVEHGGQALAHVPFEIIGEHAEEDVGTHAVFEPVVDRPDM